MTKPTSLTRNCSACGIEKPLSAFLYLTSQGTAYGTICAACRGKGIKEKAEKHIQDDERSSTTAQMRIGMKELVEIENQKKLERETLELTKDEALKKREQNTLEKKESTEEKEKAEKSHRETYIQEKKKGFLDYRTKQHPLSAQAVLNQKNNERFNKSPILEEKKRAVEAKQQSDAIKQEEIKTTVDLTAPIIAPQHSLISHHNPMFYQFLMRMGKDAPITKASRLNNTPGAGQNIPAVAPQKQEKPTEKPNKEAPREFIEKTWGPSSRKR